MCTDFCYISFNLLLIIFSISIVLGNQTISSRSQSTEFNSLSLSEELITNTISIIHLQSTLMIMASERDFPFNISSNSKLYYIRYPQSYRTTLLQASSDMYKILSNTYSTMYRIQLAVKRIPDHIKTIFRLILAASPSMIKRMLPTTFNNIVRISNENQNSITKILDDFVGLFNFINEMKQFPIDFSLKFNNYPTDKTDLVLKNTFDSKNTLVKIGINIQQIIKQVEDIVQLITNHDIKTEFDLLSNEDIIRFIPALYNIESNAYFLYQLSSTSTTILNRYVLDQAAGMARYITLSTDEERCTALSNLSQQLTSILYAVEKIFRECEHEFKTNSRILREAYKKLFHEFQDRSSTSKILEIK